MSRLGLVLLVRFLSFSCRLTALHSREEADFRFHEQNILPTSPFSIEDDEDMFPELPTYEPYMDYREVYGLRYRPPDYTKRALRLDNRTEILADVEVRRPSRYQKVTLMNPQKQFNISNKVSVRIPFGHPLRHPDTVEQLAKYQKTIDSLRKKIQKLHELTANNSTIVSRVVSNALPSRFLNIFDVVRFAEAPCIATIKPLREMYGTCYTSEKCIRQGGAPLGHCAGGYGVCCIFQLGCNAVTTQNVSYFESPHFPAPFIRPISCTMAVLLQPGVRQLYIEFTFFELLPPTEGNCIDDRFVITGLNMNKVVPVICGINTGQHMYLDVHDAIDRRIFLSVLTNSSEPRAFSIRITQYRDPVAPEGCLQYFFENRDYLKTFNYDDSSKVITRRLPSYFNNLNYAICIRRNPGRCLVTFSNEDQGIERSFQLINLDLNGQPSVPPRQAGAEVFACADDYIAVNYVRLCGEKFNDASFSNDFSRNFPVVDYSFGPIVIPVRTNEGIVGRGFNLQYTQELCQAR